MRAKRGASGAFTLLELTMVLAILAVAALVIAPNLMRASGLGERREVRNGVAQVLREARLDATRSGAPVEVRWSPATRRVESSRGDRGVTLPEGWRVSSAQVDQEALAAALRDATAPPRPVTLVVFGPQGIASRSEWLVRGPGGEVRVRTDSIDGLRVD